MGSLDRRAGSERSLWPAWIPAHAEIRDHEEGIGRGWFMTTQSSAVRRIRMESRAKLNWRLIVGPPRPDGYHDIETIFHELTLADALEFETSDSASCEILGFGADVPQEKNLITRAWRLMKE